MLKPAVFHKLGLNKSRNSLISKYFKVLFKIQIVFLIDTKIYDKNLPLISTNY